jgi:hypothetical protein
MPKPLRPLIEAMPRQAIYALASRNGPVDKKINFIQSFQGETKTQLLQKIRQIFPLESHDKRRKDFGDEAIQLLKRSCESLGNAHAKLTKLQKNTIADLLETLYALINQKI